MSPKGQGSSRHKGKEVSFDDPATRDVGKEALHSKSKHSDKEEARHDPDSECAPFIDTVRHLCPFFESPRWVHAAATEPCVACPLPSQHGYILGSVGFFDSRSCYSPRYFAPHAHSLQIWIGYRFGLEGMGGQRAIWQGFHGGITAGRCVEGHRFIALLV